MTIFRGIGGRDEFALDNIALTPVPEPATIFALAAISVGWVESFVDSNGHDPLKIPCRANAEAVDESVASGIEGLPMG